MTRRKDQNIEELLRQVGFIPVASAKNLFALQTDESPTPANGLWRVKEWVVRKTPTTWTTERLVLELPRDHFTAAFQAAVRDEHGLGALVELAEGDRDYWVMLEFIRPRSKHLVPVSINSMSHVFNSPHGAGGFRFHVSIERNQLVLQVYDQFALGYVPPRFFFRQTAMLIPLLGMEPTEQNNFFEQRYDLLPLLKSILVSQSEQPTTVNELWDYCSDRQNEFRSKGTLETEMDSDGIRIIVDAEARPHGNVRRPNIEVLEARELKDRFGDLDRILLSDRWMDAVAACREALVTAESPLYLLRRLALLSLSSRTALTSEELNAALHIEPRNRLFLSCAIKQAQTQSAEATEGLLAIVSELGESLYEEVRHADRLKTLDVVLPELLGDCWFVKDPKMAEACYQRVVKKRGNMPRVLTKLAWLARSQGMRQREIDILSQLLPVERRKTEMAHIHLRLAQLFQGMSAEEVVKHALASLTFLPNNLDAVNLVCDTLLQSGRAAEAIQVLTDALDRIDGKDEDNKRADLEIAIGEIWESHLGRRDLARERYQRALGLARSDRAYRRLAEIFAQLQERKLQAEALQGIMDICVRDRRDDIRNVVDELSDVYNNELNEPDKTFILFRNLHRVKPLQSEDLATMLQWPEFSADWQGLYGDLVETESNRSSEENALWHARLGDLCRYRCLDDTAAAKHYLLALKAGSLDQGDFEFMTEHWQKTGQWPQLIDSLRCRCEKASGDEKWTLVRKMLSHAEFLGQEEADHLAVSLVQAKGDDGALIQRVRTHLSSNHFGAIEQLAELLASEIKESDELHRHLKAMLQEVQGARGPRKHHVLNKILRVLADTGLERLEYLRLAMQILAEATADMATPVLKESLDEGYLPPESVWREERVLTLLDQDPLYRARYHMLRSEAGGDAGEAVRQGYSAWRILQGIAGYEDLKWRLLTQLASQVPMSDDEWDYMIELARERSSYEPVLRSLQERIVAARTRDEKESLLRRVIDVEWSCCHSMIGALNAYRQWAAVAEDAVSVLIEALEFLRAVGQRRDWFPLALEIMNHPQAMHRPEAFIKVLDWALSGRTEEELIPSWLLRNIERMLRERRDHISVRCVELCRQHQIADLSLTLSSLEYYLSLGMDAGVEETWTYGLALLLNSKEVQEYLQQSLQLFRSHQRLDQMEGLLCQALEHSDELPLAPDLMDELLVFAGRQLFASEKKPSLVYEVLKAYFARSPHDSRTWTVLHSLHRELGATGELKNFIETIIPFIEEDEILARELSVTVDALRQELHSLVQQSIPLETVAQPLSNPVALKENKQAGGHLIDMQVQWSQPAIAQTPVSRVVGDDVGVSFHSPVHTHSVAETPREEYVDWRLWVRRRHVQKNMTQDLMRWAFENEVEKHVAVQAFAALSGEYAPLRDWQYKVWRDFSEPPYHLHAKNRMPRGAANPVLSSDLARLLILLAPCIAAVFPQMVSDEPLLSRFKITRQSLQAHARPLPWDHPVLRKAGLSHFAERFTKENMRILHLGPMQDDVYFDYNNRNIYLNLDASLTKPLSHLRHRVLKYYRSTRLNYYVLLTVSMQAQLIPFLKAAYAALKRRGLESLAVSIGLRHDPVASALQKVDRERANALFSKVLRQGFAELGPTLQAMSEQVHRINFAETLDLIGQLEEVFALDLAAPLSPEATRAIQSSDLLKTLLELSVMLRLE